MGSFGAAVGGGAITEKDFGRYGYLPVKPENKEYNDMLWNYHKQRYQEDPAYLKLLNDVNYRISPDNVGDDKAVKDKQFRNKSKNQMQMQQATDTLKKRLAEVDESRYSAFAKSIFAFCRVTLKLGSKLTAEELDLYLTVNAVYNIVTQADADEDLRAKLLAFFALRETYLEDESHDYCYYDSRANRFCTTLAEFLQEGPVHNFLYRHSLANRARWEDVLTLTNDLPTQAGHFFRSPGNHFHLYETIIARAINELKKGKVEPSEIWFSADNIDQDQPLTQHELHIMRQRSKTLRDFIEYTEGLSRQADAHKQSLYERLLEFRRELQKGDAKVGDGNEMEAGSSVYVVVAKFAEWFHGLKPEYQKALYLVGDGRLGYVLKFMLDTNVKNTVFSCAFLNGKGLEEILSASGVKEEINQIDKKIDFRKNFKDLEDCKTKIMKELGIPPKIDTGNNFFEILANSDFPYMCYLNPAIDLVNMFGSGYLLNVLLSHNVRSSANNIEHLINFFTKHVEITNENRVRVLQLYVKYGMHELALAMLNDNPDMDLSQRDDKQNTILHHALNSSQVNPEFVAMLMQNDELVKADNADHDSAFLLAVRNHHTQSYDHFLVKLNLYNEFQLGKIIDELFQHNDLEYAAKILETNPGFINYCHIGDYKKETINQILQNKTLFDMFLESSTAFKEQKSYKRFLNVAIYYKQVEAVQKILKNHGKDLDNYQLGLIFNLYVGKNQLDAALKLIEDHPELDLKVKGGGGNYTPHVLASINSDNEKLLTAVFTKPVALQLKNDVGETALEFAAREKKYHVGRYLIENHIHVFDKTQLKQADRYFKRDHQKEMHKLIARRSNYSTSHFGFFRRLFSCMRSQDEAPRKKM